MTAALAGALLLASACEVGVGVDIDVAENGSGTVAVGVSLDRAAADALGDLVNQIDLEDLALAGWSVSGPAREADNLLWVRATKPFGNAEELPSILAEIAGPGVFRDVELRQRSEFAEQTWDLAGEVDPAAAFPELLDTIAFNEGLEQRIRDAAGGASGEALTRGLTLRLSIDLPGDLRSGGGDFTWEALGEGSDAAPVQISMVSIDENTTAKTLRLVGLAAAALFVLALLLNLLGWWYVRRHRKRRERTLLARAGSEELPSAAGGAGAGADGGAGAAGAADDERLWDAADAGQPWDAADAGQALDVAGVSGEESWDSTDAGVGDPTARFEPAGDTAPATGIDDDIDWGELEHAEYEDLSTRGAAPADDLAVSGADASAGDWTASLETTPPAGSATGGEAWLAGEGDTADTVQPAAEPEAADAVEPDDEPTTIEQSPDEAETTGQAELIDTAETLDEADPTSEPDTADDAAATDAVRAADAAAPADTTDGPQAIEQPPDEARDAAPTAPAAPARALRLVVIGGWGVLFQPADPAGELLIPFVRRSGSRAPSAEIREAYRLATLGRLSPAELWEACGLTGEPTWTHGPYTGRMTVSAGAADFVRSLLGRGIAVGCVTNDVSDWSWRLRAWTGFDAIAPWVVSSDIGIGKPDPGVFEMLRRVSEIPFANCLVIDSDIPTLDAARSLGMSTALFGPRDPDRATPDTTHPAAGDFTDLLRRSR